jgi:peptidoglycan/LPS O-acetylase OafA/YrhL
MVVRQWNDGPAPSPGPAATRPARRFDWPRVVIGLIVTLVVSVPTLAIEEDWHGQPLIDQPDHKWVLPTILVAVAFVIGGMIAASRRRWRLDGALHGLSVGVVATALLLAADVVRRHSLHKAANPGVFKLWVVAAIAASALGAIGGAFRPWDNRTHDQSPSMDG